MLRNLIIFSVVIFLVGSISFFIGQQYGTIKNQDDVLGKLVMLQNSHFDQSSKVKSLIDLFNKLEKDPAVARSNILVALILSYEDDLRLKSILNEDLGSNNLAIKTNVLLDEFFEKNPIPECISSPREQLMECHIKNGI